MQIGPNNFNFNDGLFIIVESGMDANAPHRVIGASYSHATALSYCDTPSKTVQGPIPILGNKPNVLINDNPYDTYYDSFPRKKIIYPVRNPPNLFDMDPFGPVKPEYNFGMHTPPPSMSNTPESKYTDNPFSFNNNNNFNFTKTTEDI